MMHKISAMGIVAEIAALAPTSVRTSSAGPMIQTF